MLFYFDEYIFNKPENKNIFKLYALICIAIILINY